MAKGNFYYNDSAEHSQNVVNNYNYKLFGLRSRDEHRDLTCEQIEIINSSVTFCGGNSKNVQGNRYAFNQSCMCAKKITHHDSETFQITNYYREYLVALGKMGAFY